VVVTVPSGTAGRVQFWASTRTHISNPSTRPGPIAAIRGNSESFIRLLLCSLHEVRPETAALLQAAIYRLRRESICLRQDDPREEEGSGESWEFRARKSGYYLNVE
jgi:hypothetical protein